MIRDGVSKSSVGVDLPVDKSVTNVGRRLYAIASTQVYAYELSEF